MTTRRKDDGDFLVSSRAPESFADSVSSSRAGDRFHYVWAAVQSLKLLDVQSQLREVWIEGAAGTTAPGDEIIDIAEYYGSGPKAIKHVVVRQLKYSSKRADRSLGLSELGPTLRKFSLVDSNRDAALRLPSGATAHYVITSNRAIGVALQKAIDRVLRGESIAPSSIAGRLLAWLQMDRAEAANLLRRINFDGAGAELKSLRAELDSLTSELTGELDSTIPAVLIEHISRRASGESDGPIDLAVLAMAFGTMVDDLVPAPSLIPSSKSAVPREAYRNLAESIMQSLVPTVISAVGGAGKTTFAASLPSLLEERAIVVVYDCFGNGSYRAPNTPRHRHRDGLVQIASDLAALGLCTPIIPRAATAATELLKAFVSRLKEARRRAIESSPGTDLVVIIDAADNAAIAADARGDETFVRDLLRLEPIDGVHIVLTARPYRIAMLEPRPDLVPLHLPEFLISETAAMLRAAYREATDHDVDEFHRRTSANPRIQALAISDSISLHGCLGSLAGIAPDGMDPVGQMLGRQLDNILDSAGSDRNSLDFAGQLLATLRPRIPISVLASLTESDAGLIRSFVSDLGRGLLIEDEAIQFLDEPTESFFRGRYQLSPSNAERVISVLSRLSQVNAYAAASLPQVLWEAGRFEELANLALSEGDLPDTGEVERRQIAQLRISFALRAAIRLSDPVSVVELAMVAGASVASSERRYALLRNQPDLAGESLSGPTLDEIRAARLFPSDWPGSVLAAEAVMLSMQTDRAADALNRLRAAQAAIYARAQSHSEENIGKLEPRHGADVALAAALLRGSEAATSYLEGWQPNSWIFDQARSMASVLLSRREGARVDELGILASTAALSLAICSEMQRLGIELSTEHAERAWLNLRGARIDIDHEDFSLDGSSDAVYRGVAWIAAWSVRSGSATRRQARNLLTKYLPNNPPAGLGDYRGRDNAGLLHAYALQAALHTQPLKVEDLEPPPGRHSRSTREEEQAQLARLLPWLQEWARWALNETSDADTHLILADYPTSRTSYRDPILLRRIAGPIAAQLARTSQSPQTVSQFTAILEGASTHSGLYAAMHMIASLQGDDRYSKTAYSCAASAADSTESEHQTADQMADDLVRIARAVYAFDPAEARAYFERAVTIVSRVGDDGWQRWESIVALATNATLDDAAEACVLGTHLAHVAERIEPYLYSGFDTSKLIDALQEIAGPRALAIVSQWRDRRFGDFGSHIASIRHDGRLLEGHAALSIALSPFSATPSVGSELKELAANGELTDARFAAIQQLVWAQGDEIDSSDVGPELSARFRLHLRPPLPVKARVSSSLDDPKFEAARLRKLEVVREVLRGLDLSAPREMSAAAAALREVNYGSDMSVLVDEMERRPPNAWAAIIAALISTDSFSSWERGDFIRRVGELQSSSQAFRAALVRLGDDYLRRHATDITSGFTLGLDLESLASILQTSVPAVVQRALALTDAEVAVASADSCYRLAGGIALLLSPSDAVRALQSALASLESALEIEGWHPDASEMPTSDDVNYSVAALLWSALADPRTAIRWRATHAVRFLISYGDEQPLQALATLAVGGSVPGFSDQRFPFYQMHAVEGFLVAAERAAIEDPARLGPLMASITTLQEIYPDHVRVQRICHAIAIHRGDDHLGRVSSIARQGTKSVPRFNRQRAPKPYGHDAIRSEFSFHFDIDEYAIAPLSNSFIASHNDVIQAMSDLILDEWGYRDSPHRALDPRRASGTYENEETYFHKYESPKADDLEYYLTHHAILTVAGRLLRTKTRFLDPDDGADAFYEWFRSFDLARDDRLWISDARRPVPISQEARQHGYGSDWLWKVTADDFVREFMNEDGWVTVHSAARQSEYRIWDNTFVSSALVSQETGHALIRALQTAPSFDNHRLPLTGDRDFTFDLGLFQLQGWIDSPESASGADSQDDFARDVHYPTPRPSKWVRDLLGMTQSADNLSWTRAQSQDPIAVSESWSQKTQGRELSGPDGFRLRVSRSFLEDVANRTGRAVIVEVRIDRFESSKLDSQDHGSIGYLDDYVKFFLFTPADGWRDFKGRSIAWSEDRGEPR